MKINLSHNNFRFLEDRLKNKIKMQNFHLKSEKLRKILLDNINKIPLPLILANKA